MEYVFIKAFELIDFAEQYIKSGSGILPITPWRALSQVKNPSAKEDDILLIVARDENRQVKGYIGILPTDSENSLKGRIYWNTCWWSERESGAEVPMTLFLHFLKICDNRVAFSDLSEYTYGIIQRLGAFKCYKRNGAILRIISSLQKRLENKRDKNTFQKLLATLKVIGLFDTLMNIRIKKSVLKYLKESDDSLRFQWMYDMDDSHEEFIKAHCNNSLIIPDCKMFRWWKQYPWLIPADASLKEIGKRYYFSAFANQVELKIIEISRKEELVGLGILSIRDGVSKTNYLYYEKEYKLKFFKGLFDALLSEKKVHSLISFHEDFVSFIQAEKQPFIRIKTIARHTACSNTLLPEIKGDLEFQDGNGDYIFT